MTEIEIKALCDDHDDMVKRILALGGEDQGWVREVDHYYNHPSRDFATSREAFRVRMVGDVCKMTYKGPLLPGKAKIREEIETVVGDLDATKTMLVRLGFVPLAIVEKKRRNYRLGDMIISLDDVSGLGRFIEIEAMGMSGAGLEDAVVALARKLGIEQFEPRSYLTMILQNRET